jgi:hypothetical protein
MKTLKAIKYKEGYVFVDETDEPYPIGFHLKKNEIIEVKGIGEKSGEIFHDKGFNYKGEVVKIVGQYNLNIPKVHYVELDLNFLEKELRLHRDQIKKAEDRHQQDRILQQCDTISFLKVMYKSEMETNKYSLEDLHKAFELGRKIGYGTWDELRDSFINSLYPPIISIDIETIFVMPQENGERSDGKITDEICLDSKFNTLEVPVISYKYGKEYLRLMNINYENKAIKED